MRTQSLSTLLQTMLNSLSEIPVQIALGKFLGLMQSLDYLFSQEYYVSDGENKRVQTLNIYRKEKT